MYLFSLKRYKKPKSFGYYQYDRSFLSCALFEVFKSFINYDITQMENRMFEESLNLVDHRSQW